jgi:hypothetical protein
MPLVYVELKRLAAYHLHLEQGPQSLPCTAVQKMVASVYSTVPGIQDGNLRLDAREGD